ncbi:MAG TPA: hypothetical protein VF395_13335 [Polyangiaceae bacterium]
MAGDQAVSTVVERLHVVHADTAKRAAAAPERAVVRSDADLGRVILPSDRDVTVPDKVALPASGVEATAGIASVQQAVCSTFYTSFMANDVACGNYLTFSKSALFP